MAAPAIFYSDLTSGPKTGGQNDKGVFVTIWGKNFGATQGTSYVTIGGGTADNYPEWSDTKVCFQLGANAASGNIVINVANTNSNGVSFTVRSGNIYFVNGSAPGAGTGTYADPWSTPASYYAACNGSTGNTCYFRAGTYSGEYAYAGWNTNFCIDATRGGASGLENAYIAYPGETVTFSAQGGGLHHCFRPHGNTYYILISKLTCIATQDAIDENDYWRIVGNDLQGLSTPASSGIIFVSGDYSFILGNTIHGGTSASKQDHAIYLSYASNCDIGWNYIYDNQFGEGPMISVNLDGANAAGQHFQNDLIHDNLIDMTDHASRAIGVIDVGSLSSIYVYNNVVIGPSHTEDYCATLYTYGQGPTYWYNNTVYNCGTANVNNPLFQIRTGTASTTLKNNIFYAKTGTLKYFVNMGSVTPTNTNNCWYGIGAFASHVSGDYGTNANSVEADPVFISTSDFHLQSSSPCIDTGVDLSATFTKDKDGVTRSTFDIGAYEYIIEYSRGDEGGLPTGDSDLETAYSSTEKANVASINATYVGQTGLLGLFILHEYKDVCSRRTAFNATFYGRSNIAGSTSPIYLQIYNRSTGLWETLNINNSVVANTNFSLTGTKSTNLANYYNSSNQISCRIYQEVK